MPSGTASSDQETSAPQSPSRHPGHRYIRRGAGAVIVAATLLGLLWVVRATEITSTSFDQPIDHIEIDAAAGNIVLEGNSSGHVRLHSRTSDGIVNPAEVTHDVDGDQLRISTRCRGSGFLPSVGCRADITVTVPRGVSVNVLSSGSIEARELSTSATLESSSGRIDVVDHVGLLEVRSRAGDIVVTNLTADEAQVRSRAGSVRVDAAVPLRSLDAESSTDAVTVILPSGQAYDVEAKSRTASSEVDALTRPSSIYKVRAFSTEGQVTVTTR